MSVEILSAGGRAATRSAVAGLCAVVLATTACPSRASAQRDVSDEIQHVLSKAEGVLGDGFARSLPQPSASGGVAYSFDPVTANFRREPATFGQLYLDRADTLGARRFNLSFAYTYTELDELEGMKARSLRHPAPIPFDDLLAAVEIPHFGVKAAVHGFLFGFGYGVTDNLDVNVAVPVLYSDIRTSIDVAAAAVSTEGELLRFSDHVTNNTHDVDIGDVVLRGKYRFLELDDLHAAGGLVLRLPSGNEHDLQGAGYVEVAPALFLSTRIFEPARWVGLQGHANTAIGINASDVDSSEARWGVGMDWRITDSATAAVAFLGRHPFARIGEPGSFQFPRCTSDLATCAADPSVRQGTLPLFGLTGDRTNYYTASVGGRLGLWRDTVFAFVNVAIPLNDGFVRVKPIPLAGIEATL